MRCSQHQQRFAAAGEGGPSCWEPASREEHSNRRCISSESFNTAAVTEEDRSISAAVTDACICAKGVFCLAIHRCERGGRVDGRTGRRGGEVVHGLCAAPAQLPSFNTRAEIPCRPSVAKNPNADMVPGNVARAWTPDVGETTYGATRAGGRFSRCSGCRDPPRMQNSLLVARHVT